MRASVNPLAFLITHWHLGHAHSQPIYQSLMWIADRLRIRFPKESNSLWGSSGREPPDC